MLKDQAEKEMAMSRCTKVAATCGVVSVFLFSVGWANAQTPQQREAERVQQLQNDNARRQQEETNRGVRALTPGSSIPSVPSAGGPTTSGAGSSSSGARVPQETRQTWEKQPLLAPDRNPLIGRWARQTADQSTLAGAIMSMVSAGVCGLFFGPSDGFVEFRPTTLVAVDRSGREEVLAEVTYRGRAKRVAVLPKVSPQALIDLFVFDVDGADRITLSNSDCQMVRAGAVGARASANQVTSASSLGATSAPGALAVSAGFAAPGGAFQPLAEGTFFVLKESADVVLAKGGFRASPNGSALKTLAVACGADQPVCRQGLMEIVKSSVGVMKTNSAGKAQLVGLPSGTYYLFGVNVLNAQQVLWNVKTDLGPGAGSVTLDQRNAISLN
jgi:hypothetical protein